MAKDFPSAFEALNDEEQAQELVWDAWEAETPEKSIALAKKALKISPDCADAYNVLAIHETSEEKAAARYQKAIEAFHKNNGEQFFQENTGYFWGIIETRPYMRAMEGYGRCLWDCDEKEAAVKVYQDMLGLNPNDNQGVRYMLISWLLILEKNDEARALIKAYNEDAGLAISCGKLLLNIVEKKGNTAIKKSYREAIKYNPHAVPFILKKKRLPKNMPGMIELGSKDEAVIYMLYEYGKDLWNQYPSAIQALAELAGDEKKGRLNFHGQNCNP
jgi:tetratricopeptide (TPR) repeat protein